MKKNLLFTIMLLCSSSLLWSQVGINTNKPRATLDVEATNKNAPSSTDGLLIPRVNAFPSMQPGEAQHSMLVYLTQDISGYLKGFHYWDNDPTVKDWIPLVLEEWKKGTNASGDPLIFAKRAKLAGTDMVITNDGRIGFGTENPVERFEFRGPGDNDFQITSANPNPPNFILYNTGGTLDTPSPLAANGEIGSFIVKTHDGNGIRENGGFRFFMDGVATPGSTPSRFVINTTPSGSTTQVERIVVRSNGNVGLSEQNPTARLDVNGSVRVRNLTKGAVTSDVNGNLSVGPAIVSAGKVNANGTVAKINGATISKTLTGVYNVSFLTALDNANYIIQLTVKRCNNCGLSDDSFTAYYTNQTASGFTVHTGVNDNGGTALSLADTEFMFTVINF